MFAGSREDEFIDKIKGLSYAEIASKGGGILNSAKKLNETSEDDLFNSAWQRLEEVRQTGTGAIEIKSGYGLSLEGELKMLRVIKKLKEKSPLKIKATFLGAHAFPAQFKENHKGILIVSLAKCFLIVPLKSLLIILMFFVKRDFFRQKK